MKRELKQQIKQDDFRTGVEHAGTWARAHGNELRITLIALAAVGLLALGLSAYQNSQGAAAERAFSEAAEIFHAPVAGESADAPAAGVQTYATSAEKHQKAMAAFDGVERRYGRTAAGRRARYYAALCRMELGQYGEAEKGLSDVAGKGSKGELEPALARLALAETHRRQGHVDKAVDAYRKLIEDNDGALPRDHSLMRLASLLEESKRTSEATAAYRRVADEFPKSAYAGEARRKADALAQQG